MPVLLYKVVMGLRDGRLLLLLSLVILGGCGQTGDSIAVLPPNELSARLRGEALANFDVQSGKFDIPFPPGIAGVGEVEELADVIRTSPWKEIWFGDGYESVSVCGIIFSNGLFEPAPERPPNTNFDDGWIVEYCKNGDLVSAAGIVARPPVLEHITDLHRVAAVYPATYFTNMLTAEEAATLLLAVLGDGVFIETVPRLTHTDSRIGVFVYYSRWQFQVAGPGPGPETVKTYYVGRYINYEDRANSIRGWLVLEPDGHFSGRSFGGRIPTGPSKYKVVAVAVGGT